MLERWAQQAGLPLPRHCRATAGECGPWTLGRANPTQRRRGGGQPVWTVLCVGGLCAAVARTLFEMALLTDALWRAVFFWAVAAGERGGGEERRGEGARRRGGATQADSSVFKRPRVARLQVRGADCRRPARRLRAHAHEPCGAHMRTRWRAR